MPAGVSDHVAIDQSVSQTLQDHCIESDPRNWIFMVMEECGCSPTGTMSTGSARGLAWKVFHGDAVYFKLVCGVEWSGS